MKTWLYLDDERTPSYNFSKDVNIKDGENFEVYTVRSGKQFMRIIEKVNPHGISLDNNLGGSGYLSEGYQILNEIEKLISEGRLPNLQIVRVHSDNPVAKLRMVTIAKEMFQRSEERMVLHSLRIMSLAGIKTTRFSIKISKNED